jgi:hypothetical protein
MRRVYRSVVLAGSAIGLLLTASQVQAQFPVNIAAGPAFANVSTDEWDTSVRTGFFVAVGTAFPIGGTFSIQPFVAYAQKGAKFDIDDGEDIYTYIEIPVFIGTSLPLSDQLGLGIGAGPQISFNVSCNETVPGEPDFDCKDYDDYTGSTDFGLVGSASLQIPMGGSSLGIGGGFDWGLTDIFEDIEGGYKNRVFYLFASYGVVLGGM